MKKTLLFAFTLSAAVSTNVIREYHYINTPKTWDEAQKYCREKFNDLATVDNQDNNDRLRRVLQGNGEQAWIGLYDQLGGWKWSLGDTDFDNKFSNWREKEPNNRNTNWSCAVMSGTGLWSDNYCGAKRHAVCYYERGPATYILVETDMTWHEARTYCRSNYTDLISVRNSSENANITSLLSKYTWIGLHRKTWAYWSDKTTRTFYNWDWGQPQKAGGGKLCVAVNTTSGMWSAVSCNTRHHFICQNVSLKHQRLQLKFQSEADLNDPAVQQQILQQLHAKLEKHGISDFKLRWTKTDGQIFHKEQKKEKEEESCG